MVWLDVALIVAGLVLLVLGAEGVVRGGAGLARRLGIKPLWIGLTIVALGTSAPEVAVSVYASWLGNGQVAVGNVLGSNVLNVLVVLGLTAVLVPVAVQLETVRRDIPLVAAASLLVLVLGATGTLGRTNGILLLVLLVAYLVHMARAARSAPPIFEVPAAPPLPMPVQAALVPVGILFLLVGGRAVVDGGTGLAEVLGLSDRVIGLTVVAVGTSLPEMATSLVAAWRRQVDIAVGAVVGSNLLNLLLVLGLAAVVRPLRMDPVVLLFDLPVLVATSLLLLRFAWTGMRVSRVEGVLLLLIYAAYLTATLAGWP